MTRRRLIEDIVDNPVRFYRTAVDVFRDRRFADGEKVRILDAWPPALIDADPVLRQQVEKLRQLAARGAVLPGAPMHGNASHN